MACEYFIGDKKFSEQEFKDFLLKEGLDSFVEEKAIDLSKLKPNAEKDLGNKARELAQKIRNGEKNLLPDWLQADLPKGTKKQGIDINEAFANALETFADIYDKAKDFKKAVEEAAKHITDWYKENGIDFDETDLKNKLSKEFNKQLSNKKTVVENDFDIEDSGRKFTKQMLKDEELSDESKAVIAETLEYARQTNAMSIKEASETIAKLGADESYKLVTQGQVQPAVRVVMGQALIKKFNELHKNAKDEATKDYYLDRTIETAKFVTEKLATESGQMIQAFSLYSRLTPEAQLRDAIQDREIQAKKKKERRKPDVDNIGNKFQKVNEEAVSEVIKEKEIENSVNKIDSERTKKAKIKIEKAKQTRQNLINKYKNDKGKNLYSTVGLTKEGIEFVGEVAKTYIDEGIANLDILAEKIYNHLKEVSGKDVTDDIKKQVKDIAEKNINKSDIKLIGGELKSRKLKINEIVKKHYTEVDKIKKTLADKLVEQAGLSGEEAKELSTKVQEAFDRIANKKKRDILYHEKARFERIQKGLQGSNKVESKTLQSEMIRYSNMGAFKNSEMLDMIAEKLGLGKLNSEQIDKINELADKIQKAPEGSPKNDAIEDLLAYRANLKGTDWADVAQGMWYANVLSGSSTHKKNIVSTFFNAMSEIGVEVVKNPKDIPFLFVGGAMGLKKGIVSSFHTILTGRSPIHISKVETPNVLERKRFMGGAFNPANWMKYVTRLMVAEDVLQFQGLKEARAYQLAIKEARAEGNTSVFSKKTWDRVNELLLNTPDRLAEAKAQVKEEGLDSYEALRRIHEIMESSRPIKMTEDAYGFAAHGTFNHETEGTLGALSTAIASALNIPMGKAGTPFRYAIPFTRIITNVVNTGLDYTPVGAIRAARGVRGFESFKDNHVIGKAYVKLTPDQRKSLVIKSALGLATLTAFSALHNAGVIQVSGGGSDDLKKKLQMLEEGWKPYSIKYNGKWYSYQYTPMAIQLGLLGNYNDAAKYMKGDELLKRLEIAALRFGNQIADMTWINSASTLLGSLTAEKPDEGERLLTNTLSSTAKGFVPFGNFITQNLQSYQESFGMPQKQATTMWEKIKADIPIARNSLNDKINALGEPIIRKNGSFVSSEKNDKVWKFLIDKNGWVAPISQKSLIVFDGNTMQDRPVTNDEYYKFSKLRGEKIKKGIEELMDKGAISDNSDTWEEKTIPADKLTEGQLNLILEQIKTKATEEAKEELFNPNKESKSKTTLKVNNF